MNTNSAKSLLRTPLLRAAAVIGCTLAAHTAAYASEDVSALNTGAGLFASNNGPVLVDSNWSVSLLSSIGTPPGGLPNGSAYLVPNNIGFPFGYWLDNDAASSWVTYSTPLQVNGDTTADTFQYQTQFTAASSGVVGINWLSDNSSTLYVNGVLDGTNGGNFGAWGAPTNISVTAGSSYTVDVDVYNIPQGYGNPTGARVEFSGPVTVSTPDTCATLSLLGGALAGLAMLRRRFAV